MSDTTYEKVMESFRAIQAITPKRRESGMLDFLRPQRLGEFAGFKIFEAPPPPPKLQVRDIKHSDGTSILSAEFRRQMDAWLLERFGYRADPFKDHAYMIGHHTLIMNPKHVAVLRDVGC